MTPTQSLKPSEIAIRGDQFTAVFDGQGRHISIGDQRALNGVAHFHIQVLGLNRYAVGRGAAVASA